MFEASQSAVSPAFPRPKAAARAATALALLLAGPAAAQGPGGLAPDGPPAAGAHALPPAAGLAIPVTLSGGASAAEAGPGCTGLIAAERPDAVLDLAAPEPGLAFRVRSVEDTTLVVLAPDGRVFCDDDTHGWDPEIRIDDAAPGRWAAWVGVYSGPGGGEATLEIGRAAAGPAPGGPAGAVRLAADAPAAAGDVPLAEGAPVSLPLPLAGGVPAGDLSPRCAGRIDPAQPDARLVLDAPADGLTIRLRAAVDTTLVVVAPDGAILCDDDTHGLDPEISVDAPAAGAWAVWAGVFGGAGGEEAVLEASLGPVATGAGAAAGALDPAAAPAAGLHVLPADGGLDLPITLSGGQPADAFDWTCGGLIDPSRPDAVLRLAEAEAALHIRASAAADTTLVVIGPDGALACDDDTYGLDPAVAVAPAPAGDYAIWVGIFSGAGGGSATLEIGRAPSAAAGFAEAPVVNPFEGRSLASAAEALAILMAEHGFDAILSYDRLEELGPEGIALHGVRIADPEGGEPGLAADRLVITDLDLEGLAATGEPTRFAVALEGIDYASLAASGDALDLLPLPPLAGDPALGVSARLLPIAGAAPELRELAIAARLEDHFALSFAAQVALAPEPGPGGPLDGAAMRAATLEFENRGYLGAMVRAQAAEAGLAPAEMVAMSLEALSTAFAPLDPEGPSARLLAVLGEALADPDQPGVLRLALSTDEPAGLQPIFEAMAEDPAAIDRLTLDFDFQPLN